MRIAVALIAPAFRGLAWTGPFSLVPHIRMPLMNGGSTERAHPLPEARVAGIRVSG